MTSANTTMFAAGNPQNDNNNRENKGKKRIITAVSVVLLLIAALWIWKAIQINTIKKEAKHDKKQLQEKAAQTIMQIDRQHLLSLAKPYAWAIRTEMLRNNIDQVDLYANEMIKEKNFQQIVVADQKGKIISSTDKKFEGKEFSTLGKPAWLVSDSTIIENSNDSTLTVSSPVMGFNTRLGTLLIVYSANLPDYLKDSTPRD